MTLAYWRALLKLIFLNPKKSDMRKKILLVALFPLSFSYSAFSQQSRAILKAGVNLANVSVTNDGNIDDANMLTSFQVGILGDIHVASLLYFQPGLVFTGKGSKIEIGRPDENLYAKQTSNPYYIEVPANLVIKLPFNSESHFFVGAGPYGAIGIAGKAKTDMTVLGFSSSSKNNILFSNDDPSTFGQEEGTGLGVLKRFDYGLNGIIGIEGKKLVVSAGYGLGLDKLQSGSDS